MSSGRSAALPARVHVLSDEAGIMGGAAKATLLLCEALATGGARVALFVTTAPEMPVRERLAAQGVRVRMAPMQRGSRLRLPARSNGLRAWIATVMSRDAVVHAIGMQKEVVQFLSMPGRFRSFVWETTEALPGNKFVGAEVPKLLEKVEALLVPSRAVEENVRATYGFSGRVGILPFWTEDRGKGVVRSPAEGAKRFLFIGRMDEDKGFRYLIPAFASLHDDGYDVALDICGSGDPLRIPELAKGADGVTARGSVSEQELSSRLADCFAFVLPSLHEGYPLTLLEACSYGKPVIATTVGSIPEVFAGRDCAMLVPPGDTAALESAMRSMLSEPRDVYERRCADARAVFEKLCSPLAIHAALAAVYRREDLNAIT